MLFLDKSGLAVVSMHCSRRGFQLSSQHLVTPVTPAGGGGESDSLF